MSKNTTTDPYKKACALLGIKPKPALKDRSDKDKVSADAYERLIVMIRAKNMIDGKPWEIKYDGTQWHYYPYWKPNQSGFGFSHTSCDGWRTRTLVGSRLEYRTRELMLEGVKEFDQYYQDYLNF